MDGEVPGRKVTFVATDVEGSTRLWGLDGEAMREALVLHDAILSDTFAEKDGRIFKHTGDGVFAVFTEPEIAIGAALDAQLRLCRERWPAPAILSVRIAVVTGEARPEGTDYRGPTLNRCARYLAVGHGGQILMSSSTAELLDTLPKDSELVDLGEHLLRDIPEPEQIFRLVHPDLPVGPAALRSLGGARHNLPEEWSSFIGRGDELDEIGRLIESRRLVSLVGAPGCGKTRLALQLGRGRLDAFPDGVWFVPLAHQTDPSLLTQSVGRKLGVAERPDRSYLDSIVERMRTGRMMLILDNCEHLLESCAGLVVQLLGECQRLTILTTSREPLAVTGERVWRVSGLDLPGSPEVDEPTDAVRLFMERAVEADPHFNLPGHREEMSDLCVQLDGLPLAIELAAARLRSLTIADLLQHLSDRFGLLVGGARTAPPHQQTLLATINWSYQLLEAEEQRALNRLAVFVKGFDLAAATSVLGPASETAIAEILGRLVDKSLVAADRSAASTRYFMLETIRSFGLSQLAASGERSEVRHLHARHFLKMAEHGDNQLRGADQLRWLAWFEQERGNCRSAWEWTLEHEPGWAHRFACSLAWFWSLRGRWREGRTRLERVLAVSGNDPWHEARVRVCRAELEMDSGSPGPDAIVLVSEAKALCRELNDQVGLGRLQLVEARLAAHHDLVDTIVELAAAAAETLEAAGATWSTAEALLVLGEARFFSDGVGPAESCFSDALHRFRTLGDRWGSSGALKYQGEMVGLRGNPARAVELIEESLVLARQMGDQGSLIGSVASSEVFLGRTLVRLGRYAEARASLERAIGIYRISGSEVGFGWAMASLGHVDLESGDFSSASRLIRQSYELMHSIGHAQGVAWTELNLAHLLLHEGSLGEAHELATRSLISDEYRGDRRAVADSRALLGRIALATGQPEVADVHLQAALEAYTLLGVTVSVPAVLEGLAKVALVRNDIEGAGDYLSQADQIRDDAQTPVPRCDGATLEEIREAVVGAGLGR